MDSAIRVIILCAYQRRWRGGISIFALDKMNCSTHRRLFFALRGNISDAVTPPEQNRQKSKLSSLENLALHTSGVYRWSSTNLNCPFWYFNFFQSNIKNLNEKTIQISDIRIETSWWKIMQNVDIKNYKQCKSIVGKSNDSLPKAIISRLDCNRRQQITCLFIFLLLNEVNMQIANSLFFQIKLSLNKCVEWLLWPLQAFISYSKSHYSHHILVSFYSYCLID